MTNPDPKTPILIAGASGRLGTYLVPALHQNGYRVTALTRLPEHVSMVGSFLSNTVLCDLANPDNLTSHLQGQEIVFSCAGASLDIGNLRDRQTFYDIDFHGNAMLLEAALNAGVRKFVYVSVFGGPEQRHLAYSDAHERFADSLRESGISYCIIRPTGFFGIFDQLFDMARKGRAIMIGDGSSRTNPIHEADLALACLQAIEGTQTDIDVGGPEILSRRETLELAFEVLGKKAKISGVPPLLFKTAAALASPFQPRIADLLAFGTEVSIEDTIAPQFGKHRLIDYYRELAAK
ncbi:MAG TPA: SDR family oxidoreductase [Calditrichia bacterium]|nr:SDR family oxidoreductase [Calditrichota bacterium]HQU73350.1 SDR family oxidoreductase [Calditrichia bacterium]HQV30543.1 SDR family oxidoreductase [Calditrichia bacterium]